MFPVYIAASLLDLLRARALAVRLRARGHLVTSSWHDGAEQSGEALKAGETHLSPERWSEIAMDNQRAVDRAELVCGLARPECRGTLWELGAAYGARKRVLIVGAPRQLSLMAAQPGVRWVEDEAQAERTIDRVATEWADADALSPRIYEALWAMPTEGVPTYIAHGSAWIHGSVVEGGYAASALGRAGMTEAYGPDRIGALQALSRAIYSRLPFERAQQLLWQGIEDEAGQSAA